MLVNWGWDYENTTIRITNVVVTDFTQENYVVGYKDAADSKYAEKSGASTTDQVIVGDENIEFLSDGAGDDQISALGGDDTIRGGSGNDAILAGAGDDLIAGDRGDDTMTGGDGEDVFVFRSVFGQDTITDFEIGDHIEITTDDVLTFGALWEIDGGTLVQIGGMGSRSVFLAGVDADVLAVDITGDAIEIIRGNPVFGDDGDNTLVGTDGFDVLRGLGGNDRLDGGAGDDIVDGGDGDDIIIASAGSDQIEIGTGIDTIDLSGSLGGVGLDGTHIHMFDGSTHTFTGIEQIIGSDSADNAETWAGLSGLTDDPTDPSYYGGIFFDGRGADDYAVGGLPSPTDMPWFMV